MRILLWHGYLLGGTGSNVYTRALAREWSRAGHDVTVICQEPHPERYDLGGAKVFRPNVGPLLPVFVLDRYEGIEAKLLQDFTRAERDRYVALNATALCAHMPADLVFANHVLLGAPVGVASGLPFVVKAHGSELEYSIRGNDDLTTWARETLPYAKAVYVGSAHIREVLEDVVGQVDRVHEVPPGVDVDEFRPAPREEALQELLAEARADPPNPGNANERHPDAGNAERFSEFFASDEPTVVYFGKLIYNKGVHILLDALRQGRCPCGHRRLRRLPRGAGASGAAGNALHRSARAPPPRPPVAAGRRHRRAVDLPGGVRNGCGGSGSRRIAAARGPSLGARRGRARTWRPAIRPSCGTSRASRRAIRRTWPESSASCLRSPPRPERTSAPRRAASQWSAGAGRA